MSSNLSFGNSVKSGKFNKSDNNIIVVKLNSNNKEIKLRLSATSNSGNIHIVKIGKSNNKNIYLTSFSNNFEHPIKAEEVKIEILEQPSLEQLSNNQIKAAQNAANKAVQNAAAIKAAQNANRQKKINAYKESQKIKDTNVGKQLKLNGQKIVTLRAYNKNRKDTKKAKIRNSKGTNMWVDETRLSKM